MYFLQGPTANPQSSIFFSRSKGLTEQALAELGYKDTIIFRPAALANTNRSETRLLDSAFLYATLLLFPLIVCRQSMGATRR
jgi:oxidoreductase